MHSLLDNAVVTQCMDPATVTADVNCTSVDLQHCDGCLFIVNMGEDGETLGASHNFQLEVEESADDTTFTDVANAKLSSYVTGTNVGTFAKIDAAAEDDAAYTVEYRGDKRYARVVINITGTVECPVSVTAIRYNYDVNPPS